MKEEAELTGKETDRYSKQIMEFGKGAQREIKESSATIVGLGGLGSAAAFYLASAGIGELSLVDPDRVELSNLNRQIIHSEEDLGKKKTESAEETLKKLNPKLQIKKIDERIEAGNLDLLDGASLLLGALDNFETRYVLNRFCIDKEIPLVHGAIEGATGQATTIIPNETPCLKCIFPDPGKEKEDFPALGTAAGILGTLMANEGIKLITGLGKTLAGKLFFCNLARNQFDLLSVKRDESCPACGGGD